MPKIKDINSGSVNLKSYIAPVRELLSKLSEKTNAVLYDMEFSPQTTQVVPKANSVNLVLLKPTTKAQTMSINAYLQGLNEKEKVLNKVEIDGENWLVGQFSENEINFALAYGKLKAEVEAAKEVEVAQEAPQEAPQEVAQEVATEKDEPTKDEPAKETKRGRKEKETAKDLENQ